MSMLETQALTREFGGVIAVNKVDFFVEKNMITGLIGPNGAERLLFSITSQASILLQVVKYSSKARR